MFNVSIFLRLSKSDIYAKTGEGLRLRPAAAMVKMLLYQSRDIKAVVDPGSGAVILRKAGNVLIFLHGI